MTTLFIVGGGAARHLKQTTINAGRLGGLIRVKGRVLTPKRTEYGKKIRKAYESHMIQEKRGNMTVLMPRRDGISNTISTVEKDNLILAKLTRKNGKPCAMRGRNPCNPSDRTSGIDTQQMIEIKNDGISNCLTSVAKDSLALCKVNGMNYFRQIRNRRHARLIDCRFRQNIREMFPHGEIYKYLFRDANGDYHGIFKLSPRECLRLQNVAENDIDAIMAVNSPTQCLKQAGNSITVSVLCAIFSQLGIKGVKRWNEMSQEEQYKMIMTGCEYKPHEG